MAKEQTKSPRTAEVKRKVIISGKQHEFCKSKRRMLKFGHQTQLLLILVLNDFLLGTTITIPIPSGPESGMFEHLVFMKC